MPTSYDPPGSTYGALIEEIISHAQGFTAAPDQVTSLAADVTDTTGTSLTVADASIIGRGIIEINGELMWVQSSSSSSNSITLLPRGRGYRGSKAQTHLSGDTVVVSPAIPRSIVAREINNHIQSLYPDVYAVTTTTFVIDSAVTAAWEIPAAAVAVLDVRWLDYQTNWQRISHWEVEHSARVTEFPSGKSLRITQQVPIGRTVQVVYAKVPAILSSETDAFTVTGLDASVTDLVVLGVLSRMAPSLDMARLSVEHVPANEMGQPRPAGGAVSLAKFYEAKYAQRVMQERGKLNRLYPARVHFTR